MITVSYTHLDVYKRQDRGPTQFVLKGEEDIRRLEGRRKLMIASEEGIHFLVPDVQALDKASRKLLERFL